MLHEFLSFLSNNPILSLIMFLAFLWACERVITAYINRNKPEPDCCHDDDEEEEEVVAMGGEEDDEDADASE